ncbi:ABC transporter permease subunit [Dokdonella koreensis]|uniref:ABC transporter permease n=1 Tax=Dokdonella koreensis DS-123 TaxID=1300342 RepID=A0A160DWP2_9GAMM|nr:ABC-2 transporter permease [Dokdonella koreensis]ANB18874.1 ABC transporter permease [Dokdonella koreensis DS-123]
MNLFACDARLVGRLIVKDWQVCQKQLAGYLAGIVLALGLIGTGAPWAAAAGALLLLVLLVVCGSYTIETSLLAERKQQTLAFVMSLPVSPMDVYWGKLLANLVIYLVPFAVVTGGMIVLILTTPIPDGTVVWTVLTAGFMLASFCASLGFAIACESEGWNIFVMLGLMTLIGPFMYLVSRLDGVAPFIRTEDIVWSATVLRVLAAELAAIVLALLASSWFHTRKTAFL